LEAGDEVITSLADWANDHSIGFAWIQAIGAMSSVKLGFFDPASNSYKQFTVEEQVEVIILGGSVSLGEDGSPLVHTHVLLGKEDGTTLGGHLVEGTIFPTLEVMLTPLPGEVRRKLDPVSGLALWNLE
jgi:predicted DNA-binding protein with PD1-like motif